MPLVVMPVVPMVVVPMGERPVEPRPVKPRPMVSMMAAVFRPEDRKRTKILRVVVSAVAVT